MYSAFDKPDNEVMREAVAKIRSVDASEVSVREVTYTAGSKLGENFASTMKKALVKGVIGENRHEFEEQLMCKFAPRDPNAGVWFEHMVHCKNNIKI